MRKNNNEPLVSEFARYCKDHPDMRFWQALQAWSGHGWIFISDSPKIRENLSMNDLEDVYYRDEK